MKKILSSIWKFIKELAPVRGVVALVKSPVLLACTVVIVGLGHSQVIEWYDEYMIMYEEANNKINNLSDKRKREIGDFRLSIIKSAMEDNPDLEVESALKMMEFFGA